MVNEQVIRINAQKLPFCTLHFQGWRTDSRINSVKWLCVGVIANVRAAILALRREVWHPYESK